jgi:arsenite oxidase large subunit
MSSGEAGHGLYDERRRPIHRDLPNNFVVSKSYRYQALSVYCDLAELKIKQGDLVEVYNDNGSTPAMAYPTPTAKRKQTFMVFAYPTGVQGNVVSPDVNEFIIPNYKQTCYKQTCYKQTWGNIRKLADAPEGVKHLSFKSLEYTG